MRACSVMIGALCAALGSLVVLPAEAQARASCTPPTVLLAGGQVDVFYDPFAFDDVTANVALTVEWPDRGAADQCRRGDIELELVPEDDLTALPGRGFLTASGLRFDLVDDRQQPVSPQGLGSALLSDDGMSGTVNPNTLQVAIRRGQPAPPGLHQGRMTLRARSGDAVSAEQSVLVNILVEPSVRLGAETTLVDFGELQEGESLTFDVAVFANTGYLITAESENGGSMVPTAGAPDRNAVVPYSLSIGGTPLETDAFLQASASFEPPRNGFTSLSVQVLVGRFGLLPAGVFKDYVTLQITPRVS